jgi:hypothetical protein
MILTWENSLKYSVIKTVMVPYHGQKRTNLFRSVNINQYIGCNTTIYSIRVSSPRRAQKGDAMYNVETFNNFRDIIFSIYLVTKTDPMGLNKRHRHSNQRTTISTILCYTPCFISWNVSCLPHREEFTNEISTLRIQKLNCHALYFNLFTHVSIMCLCFVNAAVSCQLYWSTKLILICFQNIIFEKEVCAPWFSAQVYVFMLKNLNFQSGKW